MTSTAHATLEQEVAAAAAPSSHARVPEAREQAAHDRGQCRLQFWLDSALKEVKSQAAREAIQNVFGALSRLLEISHIVEVNVREDGPLSVTFAALAFAENESRSLVRLIETRTAGTRGIKPALREALDSLSFVIRHELKAVFGHGLAEQHAGRDPEQLRAEIMRAQGLLSNCFQQSVITLARVFDPSVSGEFLFDDYRVRLKQSGVLLRELSALLRLARRAGERQDAQSSAILLRVLETFRQGTMRYLMYKDWSEFEDIAREVIYSQGSARHGVILHCFATYLETLLTQVRLRTVLNDRPAGADEVKPLKQTRRGRR